MHHSISQIVDLCCSSNNGGRDRQIRGTSGWAGLYHRYGKCVTVTVTVPAVTVSVTVRASRVTAVAVRFQKLHLPSFQISSRSLLPCCRLAAMKDTFSLNPLARPLNS